MERAEVMEKTFTILKQELNVEVSDLSSGHCSETRRCDERTSREDRRNQSVGSL